MQYIVTDMVPGLGWTADALEKALRPPLAAIDVEVVRQVGKLE